MSSCEFPRCSNEAEYCFADEPGVARFCGSHKDDTMVPAAVCQFPRCSDPPSYGFPDEASVARFCEKHKSNDMVPVTEGAPPPAIAKAAPPAAAATAAGGKKPPSEASLELAYKYFELKPEYDSLENIESQAKTHQAMVDELRSNIQTEDADIHKLSKAVEKLEMQLQRQDKKLIKGGRSPFGMGILAKDDKKVEKMQMQKADQEGKLHKLEGSKETDESHLASMLEEQAKLNDMVETRKALEARVQDLREQCLEEEGTSALRRVQSKLGDNHRMTTSLKNCRHDVAKANKMFRQALQIQATAARSNAVAAGANIGQAIGGGGGRGIGQSPGERLMQIRRNQATKKSILLAKDACDRLNTAQERLDNDLRVAYPEDMNGVGNVKVPNLWHGSFFRDFLVGQAGGNIGDAINEVRAMKMIRKNMKELEMIIAVCDEQEKKMELVYNKLVSTGGHLKHEVKRQEKEILEYVIAAAKEAQGAGL